MHLQQQALGQQDEYLMIFHILLQNKIQFLSLAEKKELRHYMISIFAIGFFIAD